MSLSVAVREVECGTVAIVAFPNDIVARTATRMNISWHKHGSIYCGSCFRQVSPTASPVMNTDV